MRPLSSIVSLALGNISFGAFQWVIFVVIAHHANASVLGHFALLLSAITPIFLFSNLGLRSLYLSEANPDSATTQLYVTSRVYMTIAAVFVSLPIIFLMFPREFDPALVVALTLARAIEALIDITAAILHKNRQFYASSALMTFRAVALIIIFAVVVPTAGLHAGAWAYALVSLACLVMLDIPTLKRLTNAPAVLVLAPTTSVMTSAATLLWTSAPLGLTAGLIALLQLVPRSILNHAANSAAVGHYAALFQLVQLGTMVAVSIGQYITPYLNAAYHEKNHAHFWRIIGYATLPVLGGGVIALPVAILAGRTILALLYGPDFNDAGHLLALMLAGGVFSCLSNILGFALTAACIRSGQVYLVSTTLIVCVVSNLYFINHMPPLTGAAIAFLVVNVINCVITLGLLAERVTFRNQGVPS